MTIEFSSRLRDIPVYPVADGYALPETVAQMASNESPDRPIPEVVAAIEGTLSGLNRYPDPASSQLRARLADRYGIPATRIAIGNGSCDILLAAGQALLEPGAEVVFARPSFSVYPHLAAATGATPITVPLDEQDRLDLEAMAAEVTAATRLVLVCNPNNPTSTAVPLRDIEALLAAVPRHVCVIVDEAYCEFNLLQDPGDSVDLLERHVNLVLLRTFSKVHGLCGLRVGFGLCGSEDFPRATDQVRQPFFCNAAAQAAAVEALRHEDEVERRVERAVAGRLTIGEGLGRLGLPVAESQANFVWAGLGEDVHEGDVVRGLAERGVLVRAGRSLGREGFVRVTCGTPAENDRFLAALRELV